MNGFKFTFSLGSTSVPPTKKFALGMNDTREYSLVRSYVSAGKQLPIEPKMQSVSVFPLPVPKFAKTEKPLLICLLTPPKNL